LVQLDLPVPARYGDVMRAFALLLTLTTPLGAQTPLHQQIAEIAKDAKGTVYVACSLPGTKLDCDLNEHGHPPMQSTFKFPLAMAVLNQIELGKLQLDQPIRLLKSDRSVTYSPLQDEFPEADVDVPLRKLIKLSVETSDNSATDIELRLIGGPAVLQQYLDSLARRHARRPGAEFGMIPATNDVGRLGNAPRNSTMEGCYAVIPSRHYNIAML
jgi:beta-lactamase class A